MSLYESRKMPILRVAMRDMLWEINQIIKKICKILGKLFFSFLNIKNKHPLIKVINIKTEKTDAYQILSHLSGMQKNTHKKPM